MKDLKNYSGFLRFVPPSDFAQEYLCFSDALGYLD